MNRVAEALKALGGAGTAQDVARVTSMPPANASAQLSGLEKRGMVMKAGVRSIVVNRWVGGKTRINATLWRLT